MIKNKGFSLIELMIVVSIIGIITGLAYTSYGDRIMRSRRLDGQMALLSLAQQLEHLSINEHSYKLKTELKNKLPRQSMGGWYLLSVLKASEHAFNLQATPTSGQKDLQCESFTFNQLGHQGLTSGPWGPPTANAASCWNKMNSSL